VSDLVDYVLLLPFKEAHFLAFSILEQEFSHFWVTLYPLDLGFFCRSVSVVSLSQSQFLPKASSNHPFDLNWLVFTVNKTHIRKAKFSDLQLLRENGKAILVEPEDLDEVTLSASKEK